MIEQQGRRFMLASDRERVLDIYKGHVSVGLAQLAKLMRAGVEARSSGPYVWDESGGKYLNCGGYGVFTLGHCHPRVVEAVVRQVRTHPTSTYVLLNRVEAEAAETLVRVAPRNLTHVHFGCSGAEAVETALKLARLNGARRVIAMDNGYHGLTLGALSAIGRDIYQRPFRPLLQDFEFIPFGQSEPLGEALYRGPPACVILEPVQGEAGVIIPPDGYLREVERLCRANGAFLVVDEIQTGLGRLGTWWGTDREDIAPDVLLVGKALSGGIVPVSAAVGTEQAFHRLSRDPLLHTSTFSGAPIAVAAAKATIETIEEEDIVRRAAALGQRLLDVVKRAMAKTRAGLVKEVRGIGLLIAIEWKAEYHALDFLVEMFDRHVILSHSMNAPSVVRLTPPAVLLDEDVDLIENAVQQSGEALEER
jgi:putrescine aminotransferase